MRLHDDRKLTILDAEEALHLSPQLKDHFPDVLQQSSS